MDEKSTIRLWKENKYTTTTGTLALRRFLISRGADEELIDTGFGLEYSNATEDEYWNEEIEKVIFSDYGQFLCFTNGGAVYEIGKYLPTTANSGPILAAHALFDGGRANRKEDVLCAFTDQDKNMVVISRKTPRLLNALIGRKNDILYKRVYDRNTKAIISEKTSRFKERKIQFTGDCIVTKNHEQVLIPGVRTIWELNLKNNTLGTKDSPSGKTLGIAFSGNGRKRLEQIHMAGVIESGEKYLIDCGPRGQIDCCYVYVDEISKKRLTIKAEMDLPFNRSYCVILSGSGEVGAIIGDNKAEIYQFRHGSSECKSIIHGDDFELSWDGTMILAISEGLIRLCDTETGEEIRILNDIQFNMGPYSNFTFAISKNGRHIAAADRFGHLQLWSI